MKSAVFWDATPCGSYKNRRFGGMWRLQNQGEVHIAANKYSAEKE
jgi:hypothetical protein